MKKLAITMAVLFMTSCAGWQGNVQNVIEHANSTAVYFYEVAMPLINEQCNLAAQECVAQDIKKAENCPDFMQCNSIRAAFAESLKALHVALYEAQVALTLSQQEKAEDAVALALRNLSELSVLLRELGILGG